MAHPEQPTITDPFLPGKSIEKLAEDAKGLKELFPAEQLTWRDAIASALLQKVEREVWGQLYPGQFSKTDQFKALGGYKAAMRGVLGEHMDHSNHSSELRAELLADVITEEGKTVIHEPIPESPMDNEYLISTNVQGIMGDPNIAVTEGVNIASLTYHTRHLDPASQKELLWRTQIYMWNSRHSSPDVLQKVIDITGRPTLAGRILAAHDYHAVKDHLTESGIDFSRTA